MKTTPRRSWLLLRALLVVLALGAAVRVSFFTVYRVAGSSMEEALNDGDRILVFDAGWVLSPPAAGDTVIAEVGGEVLVKRVAAEPGDTIAILFGSLVRNGKLVEEHIPIDHRRIETMLEHRLGDDEYFLLGDHRRVSVDSREFGPVHGDDILGRVLLRLTSAGMTPVAALGKS